MILERKWTTPTVQDCPPFDLPAWWVGLFPVLSRTIQIYRKPFNKRYVLELVMCMNKATPPCRRDRILPAKLLHGHFCTNLHKILAPGLKLIFQNTLFHKKTKFILTNRSRVNDPPIPALKQPNLAIFDKTDFLGLRFLRLVQRWQRNMKKVGKCLKISVERRYSLDWWLPV